MQCRTRLGGCGRAWEGLEQGIFKGLGHLGSFLSSSWLLWGQKGLSGAHGHAGTQLCYQGSVAQGSQSSPAWGQSGSQLEEPGPLSRCTCVHVFAWCTCMRVCVHACAWTCTCMWAHMYVSACSMHVSAHEIAHISMSASVCMHMCACAHACKCVCPCS